MITILFIVCMTLGTLDLFGMAADYATSSSPQKNHQTKKLGRWTENIDEAPPLFRALEKLSPEEMHEFIDCGIDREETWDRTVIRGNKNVIYRGQTALAYVWKRINETSNVDERLHFAGKAALLIGMGALKIPDQTVTNADVWLRVKFFLWLTFLAEKNIEVESDALLMAKTCFYHAVFGCDQTIKPLSLEELLHCPKLLAHINVQDTLGYTPLHWAAARGNCALLKALLTVKNLEINKQTIFGDTPLHCAARAQHREIFTLLLADRRMQPLVINFNGNTAQQVADACSPQEPEKRALDSQ